MSSDPKSDKAAAPAREFSAIQPPMADVGIDELCVNPSAGSRFALISVPKYLADAWEVMRGRGEQCDILVGHTVGDELLLTADPRLAHLPPRYSFERKRPIEICMMAMNVSTNCESNELVIERGKALGRVNFSSSVSCDPEDAKYKKLKQAERIVSEPIPIVDSVSATVRARPSQVTFECVDRRKWSERRDRADKEEVQGMIIRAFHKKSEYTLKELQAITDQPIQYLKEVAHQMCDLSDKPERKSYFTIKPEFK